MADNETIADIIAWLRKPREGENAYLTLWRDEIADRLEAAHRRERGDAAKLREALEILRELLGDLLRLEEVEYHNDFLNFCDIIDAALAAPPRNCDKYPHGQALQVWASEEGNERNGCFDEWLYEIAKEGGAK